MWGDTHRKLFIIIRENNTVNFIIDDKTTYCTLIMIRECNIILPTMI